MLPEMQREAHFGDLQTAEFEAAHRVPLADRRPAVAAGRGAAAGAGVKHVPDEIAPGSRVFALDRDPEPAAPSGHRALRARRRHCFHDRFDDFIRGMAGAQRHGAARIGPDDRALLGDHLQRPQRAGVFGDFGVDQIGKGHRDRGLHVGMRGIDKTGRLRIGFR